MSKVEDERLYNLLPSVYRIRDTEQGEPLRALLAVIESELKRVEGDIDSLYENWFIETCDEWVVPYIGDILGVHGMHSIGSASFSLRPYVANTMAYRRRKGTITVLEQLARDVTGWHARAVEFFQLLSVTSHVNHVSLSRGRTLDLRNSNNLELSGSPFELSAHTGEIRSISSNRGKYNTPNLGIFLWRLQSYTVTRSTARSVSEPSDGRYTFNPLGFDAPLFNQPQSETRITQLAEEINVPGVLRRRPLYNELEARRRVLAEKQIPSSSYFGEQPVFEIYIDNRRDPVSPEQILICNLSDLLPPDTGWKRPPSDRIAVDPELGRMAFPVDFTPGKVEVSYAYGFSDDTGGGPYNRQDSVAKWYNPLDNKQVTCQIGVTKNPEALSETPEQLKQTIQAAIVEWNAHASVTPDAFGIITIMDSSTYDEDVTIDIPSDSRLAIVAADWPVTDITGSSEGQRVKGQLVPDSLRPHLKGNVSVKTSSNLASGELILDGLLIEGKLTVLPGNLGNLYLAHCTLVPGNGGIVVEISNTAGQHNAELSISIEHSICGAITLPNTVPELYIANSIVDNVTGEAVNAPGASVGIQTCTILGSSIMHSLEASNSIFTGTINVERRQEGCVRFTYVPEGSQTPRRYRCQPDFAIQKKLDSVMKTNTGLIPENRKKVRDEIEEEILAWLKPVFTSLRYGKPGYAQLHFKCPVEIFQGADDEAEMGAFHDLYQPQREANLRLSLDEYMRFGLKAGIFYVS